MRKSPPLRVSDGQIIEAYDRLGNVWKVGLELGMSGQGVHKRLKKLGHEDKDKWTDEQLGILKTAYSAVGAEGPIRLDELAQRLGRHKSNICRKARKLGLTSKGRQKTLELGEQISLRLKTWMATHQHPRGAFKGGKVIRICPTCGRFFDVFPRSPQKYCDGRCSRLKRQSEGHQGYSKTGKRPDLNNQYFRSRWEANYARYLNLIMANDKDVVGWEYEVDTFEFRRIKRGTRFYTPDFKVHFADGHFEYHEVKGWKHPKGETALKRFTKYFPEHKLIIIEEDWFQAANRQGLPALVIGWEKPSRNNDAGIIPNDAYIVRIEAEKRISTLEEDVTEVYLGEPIRVVENLDNKRA